jgi:hypothetical protein
MMRRFIKIFEKFPILFFFLVSNENFLHEDNNQFVLEDVWVFLIKLQHKWKVIHKFFWKGYLTMLMDHLN